MHNYTPDPTQYHPLIPLIDDSDAPNASNFNPTPQALADNAARNRQAVILNGALNWNPASVAIGGATETICNCAWHAFSGSWLTLLVTGGLVQMFATSNGGRNWSDDFFNMTTAYTPVAGQSLATNPTNGAMVAIRNDTGTGNMYVSSRTSMALATSWVDLAQTTITNSTVVGSVFFAPFAGGGAGCFIFVGATNAGAGSCAVSPTNDGHGSWSSVTLPTNWATITGSHSAYLAAVNGAGTQAVVALCGTTPGSADRSQLLQFPSVLDITPAFLASGAEQIRGLAYGAVDGLWAVATIDASNTTRIHTSPDLITWTTSATLANTFCAGLAVMGSVWALYVYQATINPLSNGILLTPSITAAPPVWSRAAFTDVTLLTSRSSPIGTLLSNGIEFLAAETFNASVANTGSVSISQRTAVPS